MQFGTDARLNFLATADLRDNGTLSANSYGASLLSYRPNLARISSITKSSLHCWILLNAILHPLARNIKQRPSAIGAQPALDVNHPTLQSECCLSSPFKNATSGSTSSRCYSPTHCRYLKQLAAGSSSWGSNPPPFASSEQTYWQIMRVR